MKIDDKNFLRFMQSLYLYNYKINYIDEINQQSGFIPLLTANVILLIDGARDYKRLTAKSYKELFSKLIDEIESDREHFIARIFFRIGNAEFCINRY